ncbi:hypothetical protein [Bdellovibrio bacteriovorus]|uniref:Uncharacterized protein n=1 Tax=Bdellovibrio bacteriovorus str. Tiberius TaxID=1069642 RepID=K7ZFZ4_BDEBC|nr:hypothetical protein [Bdellovibrio bacteriovorus]AFY01987.1 hypothetical protein Bdt_2304 [Bdellovibrio bacteriovorus str. Tiberius]
MLTKTAAVILLLSLCCTVSMAADDSKVSRSLDEISVAKEQTRLVMGQVSSPDQKERLRYVTDRLNSAEELLRQALGGAGGSTPPPPTYGSVELFRSDSCSGSLIGTVSAASSCERFSSAGDTWGVRINGQCLNISDTSSVKACESFKGGADPRAVTIYTSDSCSGNAIAAISAGSQCENFDSTGSSAWAVKIDGKCQNISDTAPAKACAAFKGASTPGTVKIFNSDSCSGNMVAAVDYNTRCESLRGLPAAWGIEVNGRCENISDLDIVSACERYRP